MPNGPLGEFSLWVSTNAGDKGKVSLYRRSLSTHHMWYGVRGFPPPLEQAPSLGGGVGEHRKAKDDNKSEAAHVAERTVLYRRSSSYRSG